MQNTSFCLRAPQWGGLTVRRCRSTGDPKSFLTFYTKAAIFQNFAQVSPLKWYSFTWCASALFGRRCSCTGSFAPLLSSSPQVLVFAMVPITVDGWMVGYDHNRSTRFLLLEYDFYCV